MTYEIAAHATLIVTVVALAVHVMIEDIRHLEISLLPILLLCGLLIAEGLLFPGPFGALGHLTGAGMGLCLGLATRVYIHWRTGTPAFGGADIILLAAGGGMLGPMLLGPWIIGAVLTALLAGFAMPGRLGQRKADIDGIDLKALPLCPALLITLAVVYTYAKVTPTV